ncbi:MAG: hypothetical protein RLZZ422_1142 [Pseudomonadota bacterium]|jgi:hypothetical protein
MDQSLSITLTLEGGLANFYLTVQDHYNSPSQAFSAPLDFIDLDALVRSVQNSGDYWLITANPDNPHSALNSPIYIRHQEGKVFWDIVYEDYQMFFNIELEEVDETNGDENLITLTFDQFQYVSALYQGFLLSQQVEVVTFDYAASEHETPSMSEQLATHIPTLRAYWQKYGKTEGRIKHGQPTLSYDFFAREAETLWLQDILDSLEANHSGTIMENLDAYLDSLPESIQTQIEKNGQPLAQALNHRWTMLVNSLTEEESEALEQGETTERFPNSLKLRLMREFLAGNPSVLLGHHPNPPSTQRDTNVVELNQWRTQKQNTVDNSEDDQTPVK